MTELRQGLISRGYELDARLRVSASTLARFFEHGRWNAIETGALGLDEVFRDGRRMVVRAQDLHIDEAVGNGQALVSTLTVAHVGNSSLTLEQRLFREGQTERPLARCLLTAVVLGPDLRPTPVPDRVREQVVGGSFERAPLPPEQAPTSAFTRVVGVRPSDLDSLQHVNQSRYIDYADDTRELAVLAAALPGKRGESPRRMSIEYAQETTLGEELSAALWPLDEAGRRVACVLRNLRSGAVSARALLEM